MRSDLRRIRGFTDRHTDEGELTHILMPCAKFLPRAKHNRLYCKALLVSGVIAEFYIHCRMMFETSKMEPDWIKTFKCEW